MPDPTTARAFENNVEDILLTQGGWKSCAELERVQEYRTGADTEKIDVRKAVQP